MSVELAVYCRRDRLPTAGEWQRRLAAAGFEVTFPKLTLASHTGYLPFEFAEDDTGFELQVDALVLAEVPEYARAALGDRDCVARFTFRQEDELVVALAAAAVLAQATDGLLDDAEADRLADPEESLADARQLAAEHAAARRRVAEQKRSPAEWAKMCRRFATALDPAYEQNKAVKGSLLELVRRDATGLHASHNFIRVRDTYHQGFAVLFSPRQSDLHLESPFVCGGRFDHNFDVRKAFASDLGVERRDPRLAGWTSRHEWRSNTPQLLERCFAAAEAHLFPHYRAVLARGAESLARLYTSGHELLQKLNLPEEPSVAEVKADPFAPVYAKAMGLDVDPRDWEALVRHAAAVMGAHRLGLDVKAILESRRVASGKATRLASPEAEPGLPGSLRDVATVLTYIEDFWSVRDELLDFVSVLRRLPTWDS